MDLILFCRGRDQARKEFREYVRAALPETRHEVLSRNYGLNGASETIRFMAKERDVTFQAVHNKITNAFKILRGEDHIQHLKQLEDSILSN